MSSFEDTVLEKRLIHRVGRYTASWRKFLYAMNIFGIILAAVLLGLAAWYSISDEVCQHLPLTYLSYHQPQTTLFKSHMLVSLNSAFRLFLLAAPCSIHCCMPHHIHCLFSFHNPPRSRHCDSRHSLTDALPSVINCHATSCFISLLQLHMMMPLWGFYVCIAFGSVMLAFSFVGIIGTYSAPGYIVRQRCNGWMFTYQLAVLVVFVLTIVSAVALLGFLKNIEGARTGSPRGIAFESDIRAWKAAHKSRWLDIEALFECCGFDSYVKHQYLLNIEMISTEEPARYALRSYIVMKSLTSAHFCDHVYARCLNNVIFTNVYHLLSIFVSI